MIAEGVQVISDEVSRVLACSCKAAVPCKIGNCLVNHSRYHALSFVHVIQVYAKMNGHQKKHYVVNQNQILKKLNLNLVWNNHSQNCHFEFFPLL